MNLSRRWLEAFLRRPLDAKDLVEKLAMLGAPVDSVKPLHAELKDLVVARVEEVRPHPNADRLTLCTVNAGGAERQQVVCGATNVEAGKKYPFAPVGAVLPGGLKIERRKIRGETSEGMLCSARELGLGTDHEGIMTLDTDADPGGSLLAALALGDDRLELDVSPVRPDLLGHKGVARELAAAYGTTWRLPEIERGSGAGGPGRGELPSIRPTAERTGAAGGVTVSIEPDAACARFAAAVIKGLKVGPSPTWLKTRLESVGIRSISNVVDATNYVMLELGQPLHAYDLAKVPGPVIVVRQAQTGERLTTLDGVDRTLPEGITVVADGEGVSGIGGVMGGRSSEVTDATVDVLLEAAWWHPGPLRRTRKALGLFTEASQRFERGTDLWAIPDALRRCVEVVLATAGGTLEEDPLDLWPEPIHPPRIFLRTGRAAQVLGVELPTSVIERCLVAVGCTIVFKPEESRIAVSVPGWRPDLREEIDLIEEVARIHGYGAFPDELRPFRAGNQVDAPIEVAANQVRRHAVAEGLYECILLGVGPSEGGPGESSAQVAVLNPLSAEHGFLRASLLPGLVRQAEANWANQVRDVRLFEMGVVFGPGGSDGRPLESTRVGMILTGARSPAHWTDGGVTPDVDRWDLKGLFERTASLAYPAATVQVEGDGWVARSPEARVVGRAKVLVADAPPWAAPLFGLEVEVDPGGRPVRGYSALPTTPAATRDLALLVPAGVAVQVVESAIGEAAGSLLESVRVLDEYRGKALPEGRRSVALRLVFRSNERTLRDAEVEAIVQRILTTLGKALDVTLRTA